MECFALIQNKNSFTKIHDHPDKGCLLKVLSGYLIEECYNNNEKYFSFDKIDFKKFGEALKEQWELKKKLSNKVTNYQIDKIFF